MSANPPDDAFAFTPNPDIDLNLNAAAAAYEVESGINSLVSEILESPRPLREVLFDDTSGGMTKKEFVRGFRAWQQFLRAKEAAQGMRAEQD